jgi:hypothetical protein
MLPEDTPTRRRRVFVNAVVDADGRVRLELPVGMDLANVLRTFTVEFDEPVPEIPYDPEREALIEQTAGSIPDFPLDADEGFVWDEEEEDEEPATTDQTNATTEQQQQ